MSNPKPGRKWNHMMDLAFTIESPRKDPYRSTNREMLDALERRIKDIRDEFCDSMDKPVGDWTGNCGDTYEVGS